MKVKTNYKGETIFDSLEEVIMLELKYFFILDKWIMKDGKWVPLKEEISEETKKIWKGFTRKMEEYAWKSTNGNFIEKFIYKYFISMPTLKNYIINERRNPKEN